MPLSPTEAKQNGTDVPRGEKAIRSSSRGSIVTSASADAKAAITGAAVAVAAVVAAVGEKGRLWLLLLLPQLAFWLPK